MVGKCSVVCIWDFLPAVSIHYFMSSSLGKGLGSPHVDLLVKDKYIEGLKCYFLKSKISNLLECECCNS